MIKTIIIGKNSNLSQQLYIKNNNFILISSREITHNINILKEYTNIEINIIFNNFQPATQLNNLINNTEYISNSILTTSLVLDYFKNTKIYKIIYTSSSSVYGNNIFCIETDDLKPMNLHASLKLANEKMIEKFCTENNIDYTIARLFNMYGGNDNFSIISKLIDTVKKNKEITIVNNGNAIRDFIHIEDVVDIYEKLLNKKNIKTLNIGTGMGSSVKSIIDVLNKYDINIKTQNIFRDELKTSTANSRLLNKLIDKHTFLKVEDYIKKELDI